MTEVPKLAAFVHAARYGQISALAIEQIKIRILDTLGVAIGALDAPSMQAIRKHTESLGGNGVATLIGGGSSAPDRAAFYNISLGRYLDFMDSYLTLGETCHPSDNIGAVLAAAESVNASGRNFLTAVAVAYQVQTRLSDVTPVRAKGFDDSVQGAYAAAAAAIAKVQGLNAAKTANAIATSGNGNLSTWKDLAYPQAGEESTHVALLARASTTAPEQVLEGNEGLAKFNTGPLAIDWSREDLESVLRTVVKKHNAEVHSQSAIDAAITIGTQTGFSADTIRSVRVNTFQVAYDLIGCGEDSDKRHIHTREDANRSLPYLVAVALLDGQVQAQQYTVERIARRDVQSLLRKISVVPQAAFTARFPAEMPTQVDVELYDATVFCASAASAQSFTTQALAWDAACEKFYRLATPFAGDNLARQIASVVHELDAHDVRELTALLAKVPLQRQMSAAA